MPDVVLAGSIHPTKHLTGNLHEILLNKPAVVEGALAEAVFSTSISTYYELFN